MALTVGKLRGLQQCSTPDGLFVIVAVDDRNDLRLALNPTNPDSISYGEMALFKTEVTRALAPVSSAVLLDPEFGAAQAIAAGAIPGSCGLVVALEANGDIGRGGARRSQILPGWSVEQATRMGASGVRMRLNYHPESKQTEAEELLVREIAGMCRDYDLPLFLSAQMAGPNGAGGELPLRDRLATAAEAAHRLSALGADVYVAGLPDAADEAEWEQLCAAINDACAIPWVLRGGAADFDRLARQTEIACRSGGSGVIGGGAVWSEAVELRGDDQVTFLYKTAIERLVELGDIVSEHGASWTDIHQSALTDIPADWYESY